MTIGSFPLILTLQPFVLLQKHTHYFSSPLWISHAETPSFFFSFSGAKQRVFQWKAPTAPGSSTDALFVCVLIAAQTHACHCTRKGSAEMGA